MDKSSAEMRPIDQPHAAGLGGYFLWQLVCAASFAGGRAARCWQSLVGMLSAWRARSMMEHHFYRIFVPDSLQCLVAFPFSVRPIGVGLAFADLRQKTALFQTHY